MRLSRHEKPYFPSPGISWKAQKDQVNIIFPSTSWLEKRPYFPSPKNSKQELSVISKYHLSINFLAQKNRISHFRKDQCKNFSVISKYHISIKFLDQKYISKKFKTRTFQLSVNMIFHAKEHITSPFFYFYYVELKHPPSHFLSHVIFVNTTER